MKILHTVGHYYPSVGGMQEVVRQISERLVLLGHEVTVATAAMPGRARGPIHGVQIVEFDIAGNIATGIKGEKNRFSNFILGSNFDIITNFAAQQWGTDLMFPLLEQVRSKKVLVPTGFSGLYSPRYRKYFMEMGRIMNLYDVCIFHSEEYRDIQFAKEHNVTNRVVIPNGAGADEFLAEPCADIRRKLGIPADHFLVLSVGSHTGLKGHAEAITIFSRADIRNTALLIVGNEYWNGCGKMCRLKQHILNFSPRWRKMGKQLRNLSLSRAETVAAYHQADLFLLTSTIECSPIVLFECMASRTPFLVTDVGNAREVAGWSKAGIVLPTVMSKEGFGKACIEQSSRILEKIHAEPLLREDMKEAGFNAWNQRFTWERIAMEYEAVYCRLLSGTRT